MYCFCAYTFEPAISSGFWKNADNGFLILDIPDGVRVQRLSLLIFITTSVRHLGLEKWVGACQADGEEKAL